MAWYEEPRLYYRDITADEPLTQGDIIIAPTAVITTGTSASDITGPIDLDQSRNTTLWLASGDVLPAAPAYSAQTRWGLAMVIPHPCAMEKEWNERVEELLEVGRTEGEAIAEASCQEDLDTYVTVAPVLSYEVLAPTRHRAVRANRRLGNFPVCASDALPLSFVDFNQLATVHYSVISQATRLAGLSQLATAHLHHSLVMHFAYRGYAGLTAIEQAVGHVIADVQVSVRSKGKLVVNFILENGAALTVESQDAQVPAASRERPARR